MTILVWNWMRKNVSLILLLLVRLQRLPGVGLRRSHPGSEVVPAVAGFALRGGLWLGDKQKPFKLEADLGVSDRAGHSWGVHLCRGSRVSARAIRPVSALLDSPVRPVVI